MSKKMKTHDCVTSDGEHFQIYQNQSGEYLCPVCGSPEHSEPPYDEDGMASFQMCTCGFEFGFDDSNLASSEALEGVVANWDRWRIKVVQRNKMSTESLARLEENLTNIGYRLAFDLMPVKNSDST